LDRCSDTLCRIGFHNLDWENSNAFQLQGMKPQ